MLGGSEERDCLYYESDMPKMFDKLLKKGPINIPRSKSLEEVGKINGPNTTTIIGLAIIL